MNVWFTCLEVQESFQANCSILNAIVGFWAFLREEILRDEIGKGDVRSSEKGSARAGCADFPSGSGVLGC